MKNQFTSMIEINMKNFILALCLVFFAGSTIAQDNPLQSTPLESHDPMYVVLNPETDKQEAKFQISLRYPVVDWLEGVYFGYTQVSFWDLHGASQPFTGSNYNPSIFMVIYDEGELGFSFDRTRFGFEHQSNGEKEEFSRSWDRWFAESGVSYSLLGHVIKYVRKEWRAIHLQENPDILDYYGNGENTISYVYDNDVQFDWRFRRNSNLDRGFDELGLSFHAFGFTPRWYIQMFVGYGEDMINYNVRKDAVWRLGFRFD